VRVADGRVHTTVESTEALDTPDIDTPDIDVDDEQGDPR
jgi:hypothetical protein